MAAYLAACEKHNVKPIPKLRNQLMVSLDIREILYGFLKNKTVHAYGVQ